jgi:hypothetical protein
MHFRDQVVCPRWGLLEAVPGKLKNGDLVFNTETKAVKIVWKITKSYIYTSGGNVWSRELCFKMKPIIVNESKISI